MFVRRLACLRKGATLSFSTCAIRLEKLPTVVQKFGGTSLGTPEKLDNVLRIVDKFRANSRVACVVSALSSHTKSEGTTSRLLSAAQGAVDQAPFHQYLDAIPI